MSPAQILERSYGTLKRRLMEGQFRAGQRLEAARLAEQMHVSITPVRDVLNRLTGEGLVDAVAGGGFYVPMADEGHLRDLLDWNAFLAIHAARGKRSNLAPNLILVENDADRAGRFFSHLAHGSGNREVASTVAGINDRLYTMRLLDEKIIGGFGAELDGLESAFSEGPTAQLVKRIREFHRRRRNRLATYVRLMRAGSQ